MKKIILVFAVGVMFTLAACGSKSTTEGTTDSVSVDTTAVSATGAVVESVVSVAADPEPHAVSVSATPRAKINVTFFIYSKYTKV